MSPSNYLLLSAAVTGVVMAIGVAAGRPRKKKKEPAVEITRWKRFRVAFGLLHKIVPEASPVVVEEPSGLKLVLAPKWSQAPLRVRLLGPDGRAQIEIARGRLFTRRRFEVRLSGHSWLRLKAPKRDSERVHCRFTRAAEVLEVEGNLPGREYELRKKGKLVATVSWQRPPGDEASRKDYVLETLKTEDPLPMVALVIALEVVSGPPKEERHPPGGKK